MRKNKLQTKRKAQKGFRALFARTVGRKKVRASAVAPADELDGDVPNVGIGKALTVILILHIVAIGAICIGTMSDPEPETTANNSSTYHDDDNASAFETSTPVRNDTGNIYVEQPHSYNLDGERLPEVGLTGQRVSEAITSNVEQPKQRAPRVIKPKRDPNVAQQMALTTPAATNQYSNYTIKSGDTFYRLAKKLNVSQRELMDMNPNVNANKMRIGMTIKVPAQ